MKDSRVEGLIVGMLEGDGVSINLGSSERLNVGFKVVRKTEGDSDGSDDGSELGIKDNTKLDQSDGIMEGLIIGCDDDVGVGFAVDGNTLGTQDP